MVVILLTRVGQYTWIMDMIGGNTALWYGTWLWLWRIYDTWFCQIHGSEMTWLIWSRQLWKMLLLEQPLEERKMAQLWFVRRQRNELVFRLRVGHKRRMVLFHLLNCNGMACRIHAQKTQSRAAMEINFCTARVIKNATSLLLKILCQKMWKNLVPGAIKGILEPLLSRHW